MADNHMFLIKAILPGNRTHNSYLVLATNKIQATEKLNTKFPESIIQAVTLLNDDEIIASEARPAKCDRYGYGVTEPKL